MFHKILIANRGEIAVRIIRACRELDIRSVLVYSQADADSMAVRLADEAVCIGPARSAQSYLCIDRILSVAALCDVSAIHPGYGFLSENAYFAEACRKHGGFYLGSIGGPAAILAQNNIKSIECVEYPELGMEAIWKIEVQDFPAFILVDDKGNDFFKQLKPCEGCTILN